MNINVNDITIRDANPQDADDISRVLIAAWQEAYAGVVDQETLTEENLAPQTQEWTSQLSQDSSTVQNIVAERHNEIYGFAQIGPSRDDDRSNNSYEIYATYLTPVAWGQGIARELIRKIDNWLPENAEVSLWVNADNQRARQFYQRNGFVADGRERTNDFAGTEVTEVRYRRR